MPFDSRPHKSSEDEELVRKKKELEDIELQIARKKALIAYKTTGLQRKSGYGDDRKDDSSKYRGRDRPYDDKRKNDSIKHKGREDERRRETKEVRSASSQRKKPRFEPECRPASTSEVLEILKDIKRDPVRKTRPKFSEEAAEDTSEIPDDTPAVKLEVIRLSPPRLTPRMSNPAPGSFTASFVEKRNAEILQRDFERRLTVPSNTFREEVPPYTVHKPPGPDPDPLSFLRGFGEKNDAEIQRKDPQYEHIPGLSLVNPPSPPRTPAPVVQTPAEPPLPFLSECVQGADNESLQAKGINRFLDILSQGLNLGKLSSNVASTRSDSLIEAYESEKVNENPMNRPNNREEAFVQTTPNRADESSEADGESREKYQQIKEMIDALRKQKRGSEDHKTSSRGGEGSSSHSREGSDLKDRSAGRSRDDSRSSHRNSDERRSKGGTRDGRSWDSLDRDRKLDSKDRDRDSRHHSHRSRDRYSNERASKSDSQYRDGERGNRDRGGQNKERDSRHYSRKSRKSSRDRRSRSSDSSSSSSDEETRRQKKEQFSRIQTLLETVGLDLGEEEVSRLSSRTRERLYGRSPRSKRPDGHHHHPRDSSPPESFNDYTSTPYSQQEPWKHREWGSTERAAYEAGQYPVTYGTDPPPPLANQSWVGLQSFTDGPPSPFIPHGEAHPYHLLPLPYPSPFTPESSIFPKAPTLSFTHTNMRPPLMPTPELYVLTPGLTPPNYPQPPFPYSQPQLMVLPPSSRVLKYEDMQEKMSTNTEPKSSEWEQPSQSRNLLDVKLVGDKGLKQTLCSVAKNKFNVFIPTGLTPEGKKRRNKENKAKRKIRKRLLRETKEALRCGTKQEVAAAIQQELGEVDATTDLSPITLRSERVLPPPATQGNMALRPIELVDSPATSCASVPTPHDTVTESTPSKSGTTTPGTAKTCTLTSKTVTPATANVSQFSPTSTKHTDHNTPSTTSLQATTKPQTPTKTVMSSTSSSASATISGADAFSLSDTTASPAIVASTAAQTGPAKGKPVMVLHLKERKVVKAMNDTSSTLSKLADSDVLE